MESGDNFCFIVCPPATGTAFGKQALAGIRVRRERFVSQLHCVGAADHLTIGRIKLPPVYGRAYRGAFVVLLVLDFRRLLAEAEDFARGVRHKVARGMKLAVVLKRLDVGLTALAADEQAIPV